MKKLIYFLPFVLLLTACPIGLDYTPGNIGTEAVDPRLEGVWTLDVSTPDHEVKTVSFKKQSKYAYAVNVIERGEMYGLESDDLLMYQTNINGLNVMYLKPSDEDKYYMYQFEFDGNQLIVGDISLLDGGVDGVTSTESLRQQIVTSKEKEEFKSISKFVFNKSKG